MALKRKFEEFNYSDVLYVIAKIVFFMFLFYYNDYLLNDTRYKSIYETFGLKYYAGSIAISNLVTQIYECFCKYFIKSIPSLFTSTGILPTACVPSVNTKTPCLRAIALIRQCMV